MKVTPGRVVAGWGVMNGILVAILAGFGEQAAVIILYACVAALVEIIAVVVWSGAARWSRRPAWRQAPNGDVILVLAAGILIAALGAAFYPYLALAAIPLFGVALTKEITLRKNKP